MRVCVIGAGAAGLTTAKSLREEGFEVKVFEKRDGLGGLWYFAKNTTGVSVNTHATSSKSFLQFSDFPMGKEVAEFPHHTTYVNYLQNYAQTNKILDLIEYNCEVTHLRKKAQQWELTIQQGDNIYTEITDAVAVCSGLHHQPLMLEELPGTQDFQGLIFHSSLLKNTEQLQGKRVVIVGGGESAADLAHDLVGTASKVYLSLRKGVAVLPRWGGDIPADYDSTRAKTWLPREFLHDLNRRQDRYSRFYTLFTLLSLPVAFLQLLIAPKQAIEFFQSLFDLNMWLALFKSEPRHGPADGIALSQACQEICQTKPQSEAEITKRFEQLKDTFDWYSGAMHNSQPFTKSPNFLKDIARQDITVVPGLAGYSQNQAVKFEDSSQVEADIVILCTGFKSLLPFLENPELDGRQLYKNVFMPGETTLAFIGFARPNIGAMPPLAEMQGRWFAGILAGRLKLPNQEIIETRIADDTQKYNRNRRIHAKRLTSLVDYHCYLDEIAKYVECCPHLWQLLLQPKILVAVLFGPFASFQYRIHGYGKNLDAVQKAIYQLAPLPLDRILWQASLYCLLKPCFALLGSLGLKRFRPLF